MNKDIDIKPKATGPRQTATMLGVSLNFVYTLIYAGDLRAIKAGKRWIIPLSAIEEFLEPAPKEGRG